MPLMIVIHETCVFTCEFEFIPISGITYTYLYV